VSIVIGVSHSPYLFEPPTEWEENRLRRLARGAFRADVPVDSPETNEAKFQQCLAAYRTLGEKLRAAKPDVLLVFGDDQNEQFTFANFPALGLYVGEEYEGYKKAKSAGLPSPGVKRDVKPRTPEHWTKVQNHPQLAKHLLKGLTKEGFDLAFSMELPNKEEGIGHAFMRPSYYMVPEFDIPTIPFFVNCYYGPQPTGRRCYELGKAVRRMIESYPEDLTVGVVGSGGLWHTPGLLNAYLDEEFDRAILAALAEGDARGAAERFDRKGEELEQADAGTQDRMSGGTGMLLGIGSGSGETRNWLLAAAVADGSPATVVDYVPVYASPCGMGFAYWDTP
jgi:aromatic ring-opening dioxygenase catalytic subunit (LigB family)